MCFWFPGFTLLPLGEAMTIGCICPILIVLFSACLLGESVGANDYFAAMLGFCGVILIAKPLFLLKILGYENKIVKIDNRFFGVIVNVLAGVFYAFTSILLRSCGNTVSTLALLHYSMMKFALFAVGGLIIGD